MRKRVYFTANFSTEFLLLKVHDSHSKTQKYKILSGKLQTGESWEQAAAREIREELGAHKFYFLHQGEIKLNTEQTEQYQIYNVNDIGHYNEEYELREEGHFIGHLCWVDINGLQAHDFLWEEQFFVLKKLINDYFTK